ncbi:MAG: 30S ribosomal protein S16 [Nitrospirae bacterium]|nr:30S ribosomal protein S16 [Nitrospirota bacterium]
MVKIRLTRLGAHKKPFYRVVVAESGARRDGPFIDIIGTYSPMQKPSEIKINLEKANRWLKNGAQPTERVKKLFEKAGLKAA